MSAAFLTYTDLEGADAIRILLLKARSASPNDEIHCSLQQVKLSDIDIDIALHYTALSYVWGNENDQKIIFVGGKELHVTANLFCALRSLRHESQELPFWIDAICINQRNLKERSLQVGLMGLIYASAQNTIIYVGESDEESLWSLQALRDATSPGHALSKRVDYIALRKAIKSSILARPWFTRVWVLQELALSRNPIIQMGRSRIKWSILPSFLHAIEDSSLVLQSQLVNNASRELAEAERRTMDMQDSRERLQLDSINKKNFDNNEMLFKLVTSRRGLGARDPRDMIFAHIGMTNHSRNDVFDLTHHNPAAGALRGNRRPSDQHFSLQVPLAGSRSTSLVQSDTILQAAMKQDTLVMKSEDIVVDYEIPVADLYNNFAEIMIDRSSDISITAYVEGTNPQDRLPGLASWAPDWSLRQTQQIKVFEYSNRTYGAWPKTFFGVAFSHPFYIPANRLLAVFGLNIGVIKNTSEVINLQDPSFPLCTDHVLSSERLESEHLVVFLSIYQLWRDRLGSEILPQKYKWQLTRLFLRDSPRRNSVMWALGKDILVPEEKKMNIAHYLVHASTNRQTKSVLDGRRIASLENGRTVIVPAGAKVGDVICNLTMSPDHIVLRLSEGHQDSAMKSSLRSEFEKAFEIKMKTKQFWYEEEHIRTMPLHRGTFIGHCRMDDVDHEEFKRQLYLGNLEIFALH